MRRQQRAQRQGGCGWGQRAGKARRSPRGRGCPPAASTSRGPRQVGRSVATERTGSWGGAGAGEGRRLGGSAGRSLTAQRREPGRQGPGGPAPRPRAPSGGCTLVIRSSHSGAPATVPVLQKGSRTLRVKQRGRGGYKQGSWGWTAAPPRGARHRPGGEGERPLWPRVGADPGTRPTGTKTEGLCPQPKAGLWPEREHHRERPLWLSVAAAAGSHEDAGSMMWVEEPVLLWLWRRSAAAAQIRPLAMPWVRPSKKDTHTQNRYHGQVIRPSVCNQSRGPAGRSRGHEAGDRGGHGEGPAPRLTAGSPLEAEQLLGTLAGGRVIRKGWRACEGGGKPRAGWVPRWP